MGSPWGRPWGTTWFHVTGSVPDEWADQPGTGVELVVDLGFGSDQAGFAAEGLAYAADGTVIKGIEPRNAYVPLAGPRPGRPLPGGGRQPQRRRRLDVRAHPARATRQPPARDPLYQLRRLELGLLDTSVWELEQDLFTLVSLVT